MPETNDPTVVRDERVATPEFTKVPEVGRVTEVAAVVSKLKALVAEKVTTSPPARVMALVSRVVEAETVRVLEAPKVRVPVPVVMVLPFTVTKVAAPASVTPH